MKFRYRIKVKEFSDGSCFIPQFRWRWWFFWSSYYKIVGYDYYPKVTFSTEKKAKQFLHERKKHDEYKNQRPKTKVIRMD